MNHRNIFLKGILLVIFWVGSIHNASAQTPDPGLMGTHTVLKAQYNLGDLAYTPPSTVFPSDLEVRGSVHYPADLTSGPFPVIMVLHGRHETCYDSVTLASSSSWPCTGTNKPIVSYEGYDYAARTMASHGYIVISISANAINATDGSVPSSFMDGMPARGYLMQHHLDIWNGWNTTGGFPGDSLLFAGKLDMQNIGTMGHSRGGEGIIFNAELNKSLGSPYGIKALLTLAPVDFYMHYVNNIPLLDIAPYCDGDVNDLEGVHYYDNCRYADSTDETPKHTILMMGANHDFFNTVWTPGSYIAGGADDWGDYGWSNSDAQCGIGMASRFDTTKQMAAYNAYSAAFFRIYLGHETAFAPILEVSDIKPPVSSMLDSSNVFVSYHAGRTLRTDINRTDGTACLTTNTMGGAVSESGLVTYNICGGGLGEPSCGISSFAAQEPHKGTSGSAGLSQMRLRWNDTTEWFQNEIPTAYEDLTSYESIIFRATVNYHDYPAGSPDLNFTVQLIDSAGNISSVPVDNYTHTLFRQPGTEFTDLPKDVFNSIRLPLVAFTGIDMSKVQRIRFLFNKSATGAILISDLALISTPCGKLNVSFADTAVSGYIVNFAESWNANYGDTVSWLWNFGDPASVTNDTSTTHNPTHLYTAPGSHTACIYLHAIRRNGTVCTDTFCTTVNVPGITGMATINGSKIDIYPNPAKDYLQITGATNKDVLNLVDVYGRVVFTTTIADPKVYLPHPLATGVYYAVVITADGDKVYKKLFIRQ